MLRNRDVSRMFPRSSLLIDASLSSTGSSEASSPASTVLSKRYDILPSVPPHFVSFAWRYLAFTRSVRSPADECAAEAWSWSPGDSGREFHEETTGAPKFLGNPDCPFAHVQSTPAGLPAPDHCGAAAWPLVCQQQRLPRRVFRRSIAWLSDWLSTLRSAGYPVTTQDSLPAAGQALPDGLCTRRVPLKSFRVASLHLILLSQASWRNDIDRGDSRCPLKLVRIQALRDR
jgi:hypothetical protein